MLPEKRWTGNKFLDTVISRISDVNIARAVYGDTAREVEFAVVITKILPFPQKFTMTVKFPQTVSPGFKQVKITLMIDSQVKGRMVFGIRGLFGAPDG